MSFDPSLPTARDRVRLLVGDVDALNPLLADETYNVLLLSQGEAGAVIWAAQALAAQYAQEPGSVGLPDGTTVSWRDRVTTWLLIAENTRKHGIGLQVGGFQAGGNKQATRSRAAVRELVDHHGTGRSIAGRGAIGGGW